MKKTDTREDFNPFDLYVPENGADFYRWLSNVEMVSRIIGWDLKAYVEETEIEAYDNPTPKLMKNRRAARHMRKALNAINEIITLAEESVKYDCINSALWKIHRIRRDRNQKRQAEKEAKQ